MTLLPLAPRTASPALLGLVLVTMGAPAHAFLQDLVRTTTETRTLTATYDLPELRDAKRLQDAVHKALTYHGDNAFVRHGTVVGDAPPTPGRITLKALNVGPVSVQIPQCDDAVFMISSNDGSMAKWGDSANYMACGFRYAGGMRVSLFAQSQSTNGGVGGLLSGKTLGKLVTSAIGLNSDPMSFVEASLSKLETQWREEQVDFALVEMAPVLGQRTVVADPLMERRKAAESRASDRAKRLAARAELQKLGVDASDHGRFIRAVQTGDEDLVALFVEAGAVDPKQPTPDGRLPLELAQKASVRSLLEAL